MLAGPFSSGGVPFGLVCQDSTVTSEPARLQMETPIPNVELHGNRLGQAAKGELCWAVGGVPHEVHPGNGVTMRFDSVQVFQALRGSTSVIEEKKTHMRMSTSMSMSVVFVNIPHFFAIIFGKFVVYVQRGYIPTECRHPHVAEEMKMKPLEAKLSDEGSAAVHRRPCCLGHRNLGCVLEGPPLPLSRCLNGLSTIWCPSLPLV